MAFLLNRDATSGVYGTTASVFWKQQVGSRSIEFHRIDGTGVDTMDTIDSMDTIDTIDGFVPPK